ncbi:DUF2177 family protein [Thermodesulfobacteriota bacterium]
MVILKTYLIAFSVFLVIDLLWLGVIAKSFYFRHLEPFFAEKINWPAAFIFYILFVAGILIFAIFPALEKQSLQRAVVYGALFGFFTYATYDLTNLATLRNWPVIIVIVDILWGTVLCAAVATAGYLAAR